MLRLAGVTGTAAMAGCLADSLGTDPDDGDESESNGDDETPADEQSEDDTTDGGPERSPAETVVAFYEAIADGDVDRVHDLQHDEADPYDVDDEDEFTVEATETIATDDDSATVETLVTADGASVALGPVVDLELEDGAWRVLEVSPIRPDDDTALRPNATFEVDRENGSQRITHTAGDDVRASTLSVRGDGLEQTGAWTDIGGDASAEIDGEPAVTAGDAVTVGVADDDSPLGRLGRWDGRRRTRRGSRCDRLGDRERRRGDSVRLCVRIATHTDCCN